MIGAVEALNFYSPVVEGQLRSGRKSATIRLGDKSSKYRKGMIVAVLAGAALLPSQEDLRGGDRQGRGEDARLALAERDRARQPGDPPGRGHGRLSRTLYNRDVTEDDLVTVIRFSEIRS